MSTHTSTHAHAENAAVHTTGEHLKQHIHLPESTPWPFVMSLGIMLIIASMVMTSAVAVLGLLLTIMGVVGWFRDVLPRERVENLIVTAETIKVVPAPERVRRIELSEEHRAQLPLQTYPIASGIKGGIAGGLAMVIPAEIYGVLRYHSIWYVVNLLGGAGVGSWINPTDAQLAHFRLSAFITANIIQGATTLLVGILYGALLPVWPKRPILLGGIVAPILWTGLLHSTLGLINPYLDHRIDWWSFAASQVIFGLVAGYVVVHTGQIQRLRQVPLAVRLGIETPGLHREEHEKGSNG